MDSRYQEARLVVDQNDQNGYSRPDRVHRYMRRKSTSPDYIDEWEVYTCQEKEYEEHHCTCGHNIRYEYVIYNSYTDKMLILGSECIKVLNSGRLNSEMHRETLRQELYSNDPLNLRMKYICRDDSERIRYLFKLRKNTKIWKVLWDFDTSIYSYIPWIYDGDDIYIRVIYKWPKDYIQDEWYRVNISMREFKRDGRKPWLVFYFRSI